MKIPTIIGPAFIVYLTVHFLGTVPALANPTGEEPHRALAAHGTIAEAKEMVAKLYKLYDENEKFVVMTYERRSTPVKFSDRQISKSYGQIWQARRHTEHLRLMAEPAGGDLNRKMTMLLVDRTALARRRLRISSSHFSRGNCNRSMRASCGIVSSSSMARFRTLALESNRS
jgi:hypothetical protein